MDKRKERLKREREREGVISRHIQRCDGSVVRENMERGVCGCLCACLHVCVLEPINRSGCWGFEPQYNRDLRRIHVLGKRTCVIGYRMVTLQTISEMCLCARRKGRERRGRVVCGHIQGWGELSTSVFLRRIGACRESEIRESEGGSRCGAGGEGGGGIQSNLSRQQNSPTM
jgi:hypothetical protein